MSRFINISTIRSGTTSGTQPNYTLTVGKEYTGYEDSDIFVIRIHASNSGSPTLSVVGNTTLSAKSITDEQGNSLSAGDLVAGQSYILIYNSSDDSFQILSRCDLGSSSDSVASIELSFIAGESISANDLVVVALDGNSSSLTAGRVYQADADVPDRSTRIELFGIAKAAATSGDSVDVVVRGKASGLSGLTAGDLYYMSSTAGELSTSGSVLVGIGLSSAELFVLRKERLTYKSQEFTSSGTFIARSNFIFLTLVAGGGGGASGGVDTKTAGSASGGNAGDYVDKLMLPVTNGNSYSVVIGAGGSGGAAVTGSTNTDGNNGSDGSSSSFGSLVTVRGGKGGRYDSSPLSSIFPMGRLLENGEDGIYYVGGTKGVAGDEDDFGGGGGAGLNGNGGDGGNGGDDDQSKTPTNGGNAPANSGAGGGGGGSYSNIAGTRTSGAGGNGGSGYCKIEWFE